MEDGWRWRKPECRFKIEKIIKRKVRLEFREKSKLKINSKMKLKKEVKNYELWKIWWTICTTRIKVKIR